MTRYITNQELVQCIRDAEELGILAEPGACLYTNHEGKVCAIGAALTTDERRRLTEEDADDVGICSMSFRQAVNVAFRDVVFAGRMQFAFDHGGDYHNLMQEITS
jgi:hypothetical protein